MLRYLFASLIDEEIRRDAEFRTSLAKERAEAGARPQYDRSRPPSMIQIPQAAFLPPDSGSATTPRASRNPFRPMPTPGMTVGVATPGSALLSPPLPTGHLSPAWEDRELARTTSRSTVGTGGRSAVGGPPSSFDYFNSKPVSSSSAIAETPGSTLSGVPMTPGDNDGAEEGKSSSNFGKRLRMSFTAKSKASVLKPALPETPRPAPVDERASTLR